MCGKIAFGSRVWVLLVLALTLAAVGFSANPSPAFAGIETAAIAGAGASSAVNAPAAPAICAPRAVGCSLVITWKKPAQRVDGYQVCYATSSDMAHAASKRVKGHAKTKLVAKGLARGKTYYVRVRSFKGSAYSAWSSVRSVKLAQLGRKDLTSIVSKAAAKNKGKKRLKVYNSTYKLSAHKAGRRLSRYVKHMAKSYKVNIVMIDLTSGDTLSYSPRRSMYSASCLKGPYVAALNKWKSGSRSSSSGSMRETIVQSNNDTYASLRSHYGPAPMSKMYKYAGISTKGAGQYYRNLSTRDLAKLWVGTYWYFYRDTNKNSRWARSLYTHGHNSFIYQSMRGKAKVHAKPGWFPGGGYNVQNDAGIIMAKVNGKSRPYVVAIMSSACDQYGKLRKLVRLVDAVHTDMVKAGYEQ